MLGPRVVMLEPGIYQIQISFGCFPSLDVIFLLGVQKNGNKILPYIHESSGKPQVSLYTSFPPKRGFADNSESFRPYFIVWLHLSSKELESVSINKQNELAR